MNFLVSYASLAMGLKEPSMIIEALSNAKIIRYAKYKQRYILYEGTDVDIEGSLYEAARERNRSEVTATALTPYVDFNVQLANAHYFRTGTARYFQFLVTDEPLENISKGEIDGYINIVLPNKNQNVEFPINDKAILYCAIKNDKQLGDHLHEIDKLNWVRDFKVNDVNDKVALREIDNLLEYEKEALGKLLFQDLYGTQVEWWYKGEKIGINSETELIHKLSEICDDVYNATPVYHFELINKSKPTGNMALARYSYLMALLDRSSEAQLGFEKDKFPPEKSLYLTLLEHTGILKDGISQAPDEASFEPLWNVCEDFLASTCSKPRKVSELHSILYKEPFRLKKGFIECWVPTYLILKRDDYSLYSEDRYVPNLNRETIELLLRSPQNFQIKAFKVEGIKKQFFDKYREAINLSSTKLGNASFIETIRPFLTFYRKLNNYAKRTNDLSPNAIKFRNVISTAIDPEKTFFESLPEELGFKEIVINQNPEAIESFVDVLHNAIRELRRCYDDLIRGIEEYILTLLRIEEKDFGEYSALIQRRYSTVKTALMPLSLKNFYTRLVGNYESRIAWIESICYVALNKSLSDIKDVEKESLKNTLREMFFQLDDYVEMHQLMDEEVMRIHITMNKENSVVRQIVLPKNSEKEITELEAKIENILSADNSVDIAALISILKKKMK